jgi:hypothetical protein
MIRIINEIKERHVKTPEWIHKGYK